MDWPPIAGDPRFFHRSGPHSLAAVVDAAQAQAPPHRLMLSGVAPLQTAESGDVSFLDNRKYVSALGETRAGAVIVHPDMAERVPDTAVAVLTTEPYVAWARVAALFHPVAPARPGVHPAAVVAHDASIDPSAEVGPLAVIGSGAEIGPRCRVGPSAVIGDGVVLGAECHIGSHATLSHALIGSRVVVYPGARIGQDGFGFGIAEDGFVSVPQLGRVVLEDDVEIGANTTIDRGSLHDTVIGAGSRLDNLVQIGHNVRVGRGCVIVSQAGISGSTVLEDHVMVAGQAGLTGHLRIGRRARIGAQAGVMSERPGRGGCGGKPCSAGARILPPCGHPTAAGSRGRQTAEGQGSRDGGGHGLSAMDSTATQTAAPGTTIEVVDIARIMHAIPHRYPFLMIDRVVDVVRNHSAIGIKNVSVNESFFQGHFPNHPVMPGVLIIESMAQTAAVLVVETLGHDSAGKVVYFMSIEGAKFRRPVVPGDQLRIHVTKERNRGNVWKFNAVARVDGISVAEATYAAMIMDRAASS